MATGDSAPDGPLLKAVGGVRIGMWNCSWPFASITVFDDRIVLKMPMRGDHTLPKAEITAVRKVGWLPIPIAQSVRFHHRIVGIPQKVVFLSPSRNAVFETLAGAGYPTA